MADSPQKAKANAEVAANDKAIAQMYKELTGQLGAGITATGIGFSNARNEIGGAYDEMTRALTEQANATAGGISDQLNMLGIGQATDAATENLRGQLNQSLISAARRKSTELAGLSSQAAGYRAAGIEGVGNVRRQGVQIRGDYRTALQQAIANMEAEQAQAEAQVEIARLQGQAQLAAARASARGRGGGGGRSGNPLEFLRAQLLGLQIMEKQKDLEGGDFAWGKSGMGGLQNFLNNPSQYWSNGAGPRVRGAVQDILDAAAARATSPSSIAAGLKDPYTIAMGMVPRSDTVKTDFYRNAMRQALQVYYGKAR